MGSEMCIRDRPSGRNYEMLMQFYHKTGLEGQLLLETDSLEVLHQRQEIVDFIIREEWDNAWESFQSFKEKLDVNVPLNRQEVLFMESNILYKREKLASDEYLRMLKRGVILYDARTSAGKMEYVGVPERGGESSWEYCIYA